MAGAVQVAVLAIVLYFGVGIFSNLYTKMDFFQDLSVYEESNDCDLLKGIKGSEDFVRWNDFLIISNLDAFPLWEWGKPVSDANKLASGSLYVLRQANGEFVVEEATLEGFPEGVVMHSHGLGLRGNVLYVVNHAYAKGGERVDVFDVSRSEAKSLVLRYRSTIQFDDLMGAVNDVVPISDDEFYVTNYLAFQDELEGRPTDIVRKVKEMAVLLLNIHIFYCKGLSGDMKDRCKIVGPLSMMWNGITASPDGQTIYVCDVLERKIAGFNRTATGFANGLSLISPIMFITMKKTGMPSCSVSRVLIFRKLWMGGMASLVHWLKFKSDVDKNPYYGYSSHNAGQSPAGKLNPGHVSSLDPRNGKLTTEIYHSGNKLSGFSVGMRFAGKIIAGSFYDDGILVCSSKKN